MEREKEKEGFLGSLGNLGKKRVIKESRANK